MAEKRKVVLPLHGGEEKGVEDDKGDAGDQLHEHDTKPKQIRAFHCYIGYI